MLLVNSKILSPFSKVLMNSLLCAKDCIQNITKNKTQSLPSKYKSWRRDWWIGR